MSVKTVEEARIALVETFAWALSLAGRKLESVEDHDKVASVLVDRLEVYLRVRGDEPPSAASISEQLLAEFKTKWTLEQQRAFIEDLWVNHAYFHGLEGKSVMGILESGSLPARVSDAWAQGKRHRDKGDVNDRAFREKK